MKTKQEELILFLQTYGDIGFPKIKMLEFIGVLENEEHAVKEHIKEMLKREIFIKDKKKRIKLNPSLDLIVGNIYFNPKGFAFVANESKEDIFISKESMGDAFHGDRVLILVTKKKEKDKRAEGKVMFVYSREVSTLVGTYIDGENFGFVIPDNVRYHKDIYIPENLRMNAKSYDKVVCKILRFPKNDRKPEGKITEIIGFKGEKGVDALSIIKEHGIAEEFPAKVLRQVERIPEQITHDEFRKRKDFTALNIFTIDGSDSKDLDDAIHIKRLTKDTFELGVHIADVSHYVKEDSKLDKEAQSRSTSVYLINQVVPMLPTKLSNSLCSLNPNSIKLTLSIIMEVNTQGHVLNSKIYESYIQSKAKLNYEEVTAYLSGDNEVFGIQNPEIAADLKEMEELARMLYAKRQERGAIEFDFPEAKIKLDENGIVVDVMKYDRGISNKIIEEFMLLSNETIAETFHRKNIPFVFRTHEKPRMERLEEFQKFVNRLGFELELEREEEKITPKPLQALLASVKNKSEENSFNLMLLRSLQQARYSPACVGHFGLAADFYCHFTSPIRRYPDLQIHRIIKEAINGKLTEERLSELEEKVELVSQMSSKRERVAERAEDDYYSVKKTEYMSDKIGKIFKGVITAVNPSGFFVALDNTIEGFVKLNTAKDDTYEHNKELYEFTGKSSGKKYRLGDLVEIKVNSIHLETKSINFDLNLDKIA